MPVVAEIQTLLEQMAENPVDFSTITPDEMRKLMGLLSSAEVTTPVGTVEDQVVPGPRGEIPVRVYRPAEGGPPRPVLVWYHGGGWVMGDLETADATARHLCAGADAVVVSVDYGLAPEAPFPAGPEDAWAALRWVDEHADDLGGDPGRLAVGGDSAGGNLAALVALRARAEGGPALSLQLLVYPATDLTLAHPSIDENGEGLFLTKDSMEWFRAHYLGPDLTLGDPTSPAVSPHFTDDLGGVAPAQVLTAEFDPLRDEGDAYAARLAEAGVPVEHLAHPGLVHGFLGFAFLSPEAARARDAMTARVKAALHP